MLTRTYTRTNVSYVLGFVFDTKDQVLLMLKNHPTNQVGKLNGVGGKIKQDILEPPLAAMIREGSEELDTPTNISWLEAGLFGSDVFTVHVFAALYRLQVVAKEAEPVDWYAISRLPDNCMYNLKYLVPLCYDVAHANRNGGNAPVFSIDES